MPPELQSHLETPSYLDTSSIPDSPSIPQIHKPAGLINSVPPQIFALLAMVSVQIGASLGKGLFQTIGPLGTTFLRLGFAALLLCLYWRPSLRGLTRKNVMTIVLFGIAIVTMNSAFYASIARIPLGIAVTLEFVGPLGVALLQSRRLKDLIWAAIATIGILLLAPIGSTNIDMYGVGLALLAGVFWGLYIILNVHIGRDFSGGTGLSLSMIVAAILIAPLGISSGGSAMFAPHSLFLGFAVSILSTVIPFSLELEALRRLPSRLFGIFMSVEPAMAALAGFILLGEVINMRSIIAIGFIMTASIGTSLEGKKPQH